MHWELNDAQDIEMSYNLRKMLSGNVVYAGPEGALSQKCLSSLLPGRFDSFALIHEILLTL